MLADLTELALRIADRTPASRKIYPPEGYSPWWWAVVAGCLVGIIAVLWWAWRALRDAGPSTHGDQVFAAVQRASLERIDRLERRFGQGGLTASEVHHRLSAEVRRFAGTATGGDADYRVLSELRAASVRDPRLEPVVDFVASVEEPAFARPRGPETPGPDAGGDAGAVFDRAREVIRAWQ